MQTRIVSRPPASDVFFEFDSHTLFSPWFADTSDATVWETTMDQAVSSSTFSMPLTIRVEATPEATLVETPTPAETPEETLTPEEVPVETIMQEAIPVFQSMHNATYHVNMEVLAARERSSSESSLVLRKTSSISTRLTTKTLSIAFVRKVTLASG